MSRRRRNETEEQQARRELISDFLSAANIQIMERFMGAFAADNRLVNGDRADYGVCYRCSCN